LLRFYFGWKFVVWIELLAIGVTLLCSYLGARLVPYNLYHAFGRLNLKDGAIFFAFMLLGPIWGFLFFEAYTTLFAPVVGFLSFFLALTFCVVVASRRRH
jgi:uncharacterized membrane protein YfcA